MGENSSPLIYRAIYLLVHGLYTIYRLCQDLITKLKKFARNDRPPTRPSKTPSHLTLLISEEPSLEDLANVVLWCLAVNIPFVSFYDRKGTLKKVEDKLQVAVERKKAPTDHVIWHSQPSEFKNGHAGRKVRVKMLSEDDGKGAIVDLIKRLASEGVKNISIDDFDARLRNKYEFPDPDVGLCCGKTFCLYGYPPWQVRVTEFFRIDSHHKFNFSSFIDVLCRYSKCEQRFGK